MLGKGGGGDLAVLSLWLFGTNGGHFVSSCVNMVF